MGLTSGVDMPMYMKAKEVLANLDGTNEDDPTQRIVKATSVLSGTITLSAFSAACCLFCIIWAATSWTDDEECEDEYTWLLVEGIVGLCYLGFKSTIAVAKCVYVSFTTTETWKEDVGPIENGLFYVGPIVKCCGRIGQIIYGLFTLGWAIYGMILFFDGGYDGGYIEGGQCFKLHAVGFVYSIIQCCMFGLGVILGILVGIIFGILGVVAATKAILEVLVQDIT
tara:strand:+ start:32 stop:706 length:675 start_codon:yes stop_codon:yes gene_type:complete